MFYLRKSLGRWVGRGILVILIFFLLYRYGLPAISFRTVRVKLPFSADVVRWVEWSYVKTSSVSSAETERKLVTDAGKIRALCDHLNDLKVRASGATSTEGRWRIRMVFHLENGSKEEVFLTDRGVKNTELQVVGGSTYRTSSDVAGWLSHFSSR